MNPTVKPEIVTLAAGENSASNAKSALCVLALVLLFSAGALYESAHLSSLVTPQVWVHLRTGTRILEHHAIPRTGLFSQYPNQPWIDSNWGFDLILAVAYRLFGLRAIPILLMALKAAFAVVSFLLARGAGAGTWKAFALSAIAQYVVVGLQPLPYVFSILLFALELRLLVSSRLSGSVRRLYWLPLLFLVWANLDLHFVSGLILLGLFVFASCIEHWSRSYQGRWVSPRIHPLPLLQVSAISAVCLAVTFVTPYGFHLLPQFFKTLYSDVGFVYFSEMAALTFRQPQHYVVLLLVMMAFMALGRRRSLEAFELLILLGGTVVAFRIQRDIWLAVLPAIAVLSSASISQRQTPSETPRTWEWCTGAVLAVVVLATAALRLPHQDGLMRRIGENFPVKACDYITSNRLPTPIFNEYLWGSFLTWYMPQYPVVVDSRVELYGDDVLKNYFSVVGGKERLDSEPMVARAGTLLLARNSAMAKALTNLPALRSQYRLVYSDQLAAVFVPQQSTQ